MFSRMLHNEVTLTCTTMGLYQHDSLTDCNTTVQVTCPLLVVPLVQMLLVSIYGHATLCLKLPLPLKTHNLAQVPDHFFAQFFLQFLLKIFIFDLTHALQKVTCFFVPFTSKVQNM